MTPPTAPPPPDVPTVPVRRLTVEQYHRMAEAGILTPADRVELIHGWLVPKMTLNPPHAYAVNALLQALVSRIGLGRCVRVHQPITMTDSEPEPGLAVVVGSHADYKTRHPRPAECLLVVEVADSSVAYDRTTKLRLYAGAKVPVYWVVNLGERRVEVYTRPRGGRQPTSRQRAEFAPGQAVPLVLGGEDLGSLPVADLLP